MQTKYTARVRFKTIALPVEHGGWAFLLAPIVLGLWVAPSWAGIWLSLSAVGAFLTHHPIKLALGDWQRGTPYPRTHWAVVFVVLYSTGALLSLLAAWAVAAHPFWLPLLLAVPFAGIQLGSDLRRRSRALGAELAGTIALTALAPALVMAGGWTLLSSLRLWLVLVLWALPAILYVRVRLRLARGRTATHAPVFLAHGGALGIVAVLAVWGLTSWLSVVAFALLLGRAYRGLLPQSLGTPTVRVGIEELFACVLTVTLVAAGTG